MELMPHIVNWFNVGALTIRKYVDIMCDALCNKNKLFNKYIRIIPFGGNSSLGDTIKHLMEWLKN
jgi:hypothetical protein